jgi:hypothetical protein
MSQTSQTRQKKSSIVPPDPDADIDLDRSHRESVHHQDYSIALLEERYLEGQDIRFVEQWDDEKFVAGVWGKAELAVFDREKPDLVHTFQAPNGSQQNLSL